MGEEGPGEGVRWEVGWRGAGKVEGMGRGI